MRRTVLGIRHTGCPVSETSAAFPAVHLQHLSRVRAGNGSGRRLFRVRADRETVESFVEAFRNHDGVSELETVSTADGGSTVYCSVTIQYRPENPSVLSVVLDHNCHYHPTVTVQRGIEHWVLYTDRKRTVSDVVDDVETFGNSLETYRTVDMTRTRFETDELVTLLSLLTERQRETVETALEMGYYDGETSRTIEEIADALGVHETTAWEHLKKAENAILSEVGERLFSPG